MQAVDTNVVVRFLTSDDVRQANKARAVVGQTRVFVSRTVVLEVEWVLRGVYGFSSGQVVAGIRAIAGLPGVEIEDADLVAKALDWTESGMDFADALHLGAAANCQGFLTFDQRLARSAARMTSTAVSVL